MRKLLLLLLLLAATAHGAGTIFSSVLSGLGEEYASAVTSDAQGNAYVVGLTYSPDFPVTAGAYQTTFGQTCDAFIAKIGLDGKVIWSTYLGGILDDWATGVGSTAPAMWWSRRKSSVVDLSPSACGPFSSSWAVRRGARHREMRNP